MTTRYSVWTQVENEAVISLYFGMLGRSIGGAKYNKAAMIRNEQRCHETGSTQLGPLRDRSKGSIEFKLMNCSAAHHDLMSAGTIPDRTPTMDGFGYRAQFNYQQGLKEAMRICVLAVNSLI